MEKKGMGQAKKLRAHALFFPLVLLALCAALTGLYARLGYLGQMDNRVRGVDAVKYYVYLPSLILDHDLDFKNDFLKAYGGARPYIGVSFRGVPANNAPLGPAVAWSPFFLAAHAASLLLHRAAEGFGGLYYLFVYLACPFYGAAGMILTYLWLARARGRVPAFLASGAVLACSQMAYYLWPMTPDSHAVSFFATALFLFVYSRKGLSAWAGAAAALMVLARTQDGLILVFPLWRFMADLARDPGARPKLVRSGLWFLAAFFLGCLPQVLVWKALFGSFLLVPPATGTFDFLHPEIISLFFSTRHGLFAWHPLLLAGVLGLVWLARKEPGLAIPLLVALVLDAWLNASIFDWHAGWTFGSRRFVHLAPVFALGLAALLDKARPGRLAAFAVVALAFGVWNQLFLFQFQKELISREGTLSFAEMVTDKFRLPSLARARDAVNQAAAGALSGDGKTVMEKANLAFDLAPGFAPAQAAKALVCAFGDPDPRCLACTESLAGRFDTDPGVALAYALALSRAQRRPEAARVVRTRVLAQDRALAAPVLEALENKSGPVVLNGAASHLVAVRLARLMTSDVDWGLVQK